MAEGVALKGRFYSILNILKKLLLLSLLTGELVELEEQVTERRGQVTQYTTPVAHSGNCGRPHYVIDHQQLKFLRTNRFKWTTIANILGMYMYIDIIDV